MVGHVDPKFNGVWSKAEIKLVKSLIVRHNNMNNAGNNNHEDIVDVLQARFPFKEKHQVTDLYVDLVVEMMQEPQPVVAPAIDNVMMAAQQPEWQPIPRRPNYWTPDEHRRFLRGLHLYGHGDWGNISMLVETRTPLQVSSHAQKFFRRLESAARRERYSKKSAGKKVLSYTCDGYNNPSVYFGASGQGSTHIAAMNNKVQAWSPFRCHADQASSSKAVWTVDEQMVPSAAAPEMEGAGNFVSGDLQGTFAPKQ